MGRWCALAVLGVVLAAIAVPRYDLHARTHALRQVLAAVPAAERSVVASAEWGALQGGGQTTTLGPADLASQESTLASGLTGLSVPLAAGAAWSGITSAFNPSGGGSQLEIAYRDTLTRHALLVAGRWPRASQVTLNPGVPVGIPGGGAVRDGSFEVAVTQATAARFGLRPGARLGAPDGVTLVVTGVIRPADPAAAFWTLDPIAAAPELGSAGVWLGAVFTGPAEVRDLQLAFGSPDMKVVWDYPLALAGLTAGDAQRLAARLNSAANQSLVAGGSGVIQISSGLSAPLASFLRTQSAVNAVLSPLLAGLGVLGGVVVLLGVYLVTGRLAGELAVRRARGLPPWRLAVVALRAAAPAGPAALAGAVLALALTPGENDALGWWLAGGAALVALAGPVVLVSGRQRAAERTAARPGVRPRRRRLRLRLDRRVVAEATVIAVAAGGLVIARGPGLYPALAPVLVAAPAAVLVIRLYPVALRGLLRLAAARRGVTAFVGMARAARSSPGAALPAFALVLALGVATFGGMIRDAVLTGEVAASWQTTGADAVVTGTGVSARAIAGVPGAEHVAGVRVLSASLPSGAEVEVVVVDPSSYQTLVAASPLPRFPAAALAARASAAGVIPAAVIPAVASPAVAAGFRGGRVKLELPTPVSLNVRVTATVPSTPALPGQDTFLVLPATSLAALPASLAGPDLLLVNGPALDQRALLAAVRRDLPGAAVTFRSAALAALTSAPLQRAASAAFAWGILAAAGLSAIIVVMSLAVEARARERSLARLAAMGVGSGQVRAMVVVETLPVVLVAAVAGGLCGGILGPLAGSVLDLSVFTGGTVSVPVRTGLTPAVIPAAGLVALALILMCAQARPVRRAAMLKALRESG